MRRALDDIICIRRIRPDVLNIGCMLAYSPILEVTNVCK